MRADRDSVRRKLKIARGQLDGILQMIDDDRYCVDISNQLLATQSLLKSANQQIMRAHIEGCVREALQTDHIDPKLEEAFQLSSFFVIRSDPRGRVSFPKAAVRCAHVRVGVLPP